MKLSFYEMISQDLNRKFQKRSLVIWFDLHCSFQKEYETYTAENKLEAFIYEDSMLRLRKQLVDVFPNFEKRCLIYVPGQAPGRFLLEEYEQLGEVYEETIQQLLQVHYQVRLPVNASEEMQKKLVIIKTKWDVLSESVIEDLTEEKIGQLILADHVEASELDKRETVLKFITNIEYYDMLAESQSLSAFYTLLNQYYGITVDEGESYEQITEVIARRLFESEIANKTTHSSYQYTDEQYMHRRLELFHLWSGHSAYHHNFLYWSSHLSVEYQEQVLETLPTDELYTIQGLQSADDELWKRTKEKLLINYEVNVSALEDESIKQLIKIAEGRKKRALNPEMVTRWGGLHHLLLFINELSDYRLYMDKRERHEYPEEIIGDYLEHKWWSIDLQYRQVEQLQDINDPVIEVLLFYVRKQYVHQFLKPLNQQFNELLAKKRELAFDGVTSQRHFWRQYMQQQPERTAVLYVDALRYEMGAELIAHFKEEYEAILDPMISSAPSITKVGMAALLPLASPTIQWQQKDKSYVLYSKDGVSLNDKEERVFFLNHVLGSLGKVMNLDSLLKIPMHLLQEEVKNQSKLVIYTSEIDGVGENIEDSAVLLFPKLLNKIKDIISRLLQVGFERIVVTADHGFLLTNGLDGWNEIQLPANIEPIKKSRRYAIAHLRVDGDWIVKELGWSHHEGSLYQYYPKGIYYFTAHGGAKFSHGGLSIQELVVPVVTIKSRQNNVEYIPDPRMQKEQIELTEVVSIDRQHDIQEQITEYIKQQDLSKKQHFLLECFVQSAKWNENELLQKAETKNIRFKSILVSEAMDALIKELKKQGYDWFEVQLINGTVYEYVLK